MANTTISTWKASYYDNTQKKWKYGLLKLQHSCLIFNSDDYSACSNVILFDDVQGVRKASSSYVFKCIVITDSDNEHWFGSFTDVYKTFNIIEHFWRNRLLGTDTKSSRNLTGRSEKGAKLLKIAAESENTLMQASGVLERQGHQLESSLTAMYDIHENLKVADKAITFLESWLIRWRIPPRIALDDIVVVESGGLPMIHEFPVFYHQKGDVKMYKNPESIQRSPGTLRISKQGISILDSQMILSHHFDPKDISKIRLVSPSEIFVVQYHIGSADIVYNMISGHMIKIIQILSSLFARKIECMEAPEMLPTENTAKHAPIPEISSTSTVTNDAGQSQVTVQQPLVTQEESTELSDVIGRMKAMALDIGKEQDRQMDTINKLTTSVDSANVKLERANRRMKNL